MRSPFGALPLLLLAVSCGFDDAQPPNQILYDGGAAQLPGADGASTLAPPIPDPVASSVCATSVAVQGSATAGSNVIVYGGALSTLSTTAHPTTGRFCLDVELVPDSENTLRLMAQDPTLGMSSAVTVKVTQQSSCKDDATAPQVDPPKSKNVALGSSATSKDKPKEGNLGLLTDGDSKTFVQVGMDCPWYNPKCPFDSYNGWVSISLGKLYLLDHIVVRWKDSSGDFGKEYKVLVSSMTNPGDPDPKNGYWTKVAEVDSGDGGSDSFAVKGSKVYAQHVALWLEFDGATSAGETFSIGEVEVWDVPEQSTATLPTTTTTCSSIGSGS
jgi:hypothetical protein